MYLSLSLFPILSASMRGEDILSELEDGYHRWEGWERNRLPGERKCSWWTTGAWMVGGTIVDSLPSRRQSVRHGDFNEHRSLLPIMHRGRVLVFFRCHQRCSSEMPMFWTRFTTCLLGIDQLIGFTFLFGDAFLSSLEERFRVTHSI